MPHPKHRKQHTRQRILSAAARLFATQGFAATSIDDVMHTCGLTRGGFYAHFVSKAQLHREALAHASEPIGDVLATEALPLWASLGKDVASVTPEVRLSYARTVERVRKQLRAEMSDSPQGDQAALAATAMLVGALAVAQSVDDLRLASDMAEACRHAARALRAELIAEPRPSFFWAPLT